MGGFLLDASGTNGTISLSSTVGSTTGTQANLAVGSPFTIQVSVPSFGGCPSVFNVTSISASWASGHGQFLKKLDYVTGATLTETIYNHSIIDTPSSSWSVTLSPTVASFGKDFFLGIPTVSYGGGTSLQDTINIIANYNNGQQDTCSFVVNMQIPTMTMNVTWPMTSSTKIDFGPFEDYHSFGSGVFYDNARVAWNDANYIAGVPTDQVYAFGVTACGVSNPIQFYGNGNNVTNSDGVFYFVQTLNASNSLTEYYDPFNYRDWINTSPDTSSLAPNNPYVLDSLIAVQGPSPYLWTWQTYVTAVAGSGTLNVPSSGSFLDLNGNSLSAYADDPYYKIPDVTGVNSFKNIRPIPYTMHSNRLFKSYFVFHPLGGIPIAIVGYDWGFVVTQDNSTVRNGTNLTWSASNTVQANWTGTLTVTSPTEFSGPLYMEWDKTLQDFVGLTSQTMGSPRFRKLFGANSPNGAPMGGSVRTDANNGFPGLPRAIAGNVSVMNTVI